MVRIGMRWAIGFALAVGAAAAGGPSLAADSPLPGPIEWRTSLVEALKEAKKDGKPIFVAITAEKVDGKARLEPAGVELRERTYPHPEVVAKAKEFVSVLLKDPIDSENGGELRSRYGIEGLIVSPQHIFIRSDGSLIRRKEYWEFSRDTATSVSALLGLMDEALRVHRAGAGAAAPPAPPPSTTPPPAPAPTDPGAGPSPAPSPAPGAPVPAPTDTRADWIRTMLEKVRNGGDTEVRVGAARELVTADHKGDCVEPLCAYLLESKDAKKMEGVQTGIVRLLGKPGLELAVPAVVAYLEHKDLELRSNAAVTLEYVGSPKAVEALTKRLSKEKEEDVYSNLARALGRSGAGQEAVRKTLLKEYGGAKSDKTAVGVAIALAYFEKDAEAARGVEKLVKKENNRARRGTLLWTLCEIGDSASAPVVRELLADASDPRAKVYLGNVAAYLANPDAQTKGLIDTGLGGIFGWFNVSFDGARRGREAGGFQPKADAIALNAAGRGMRPPGG